MSEQPNRFLLISDFNVGIFEGYLTNDPAHPRIEAVSGPFGQVVPVLMDGHMECWQDRREYAIVWTRPESVIPSFGSVLSYQPVPADRILEEVDEFCRFLRRLGDRVRYVFVATWVLPPHHRGYGLLEMKHGIGMANLLMQMNLRLSEQLDTAPSLCVLDAQRWIQEAGPEAFNPKLWYTGKVAFGNRVFRAATNDVKAAMRALSGAAGKLVIVDLDDTIWGGIVGEVGWQGLHLGGHSAIGEAFTGFQSALKSLTHRGVLLGIVSRNTESVALEAIENHPEMVLRLTDFAGWRINWNDKAGNIVDLVSELNLGLQSVVFIDDSPVERARVRDALPEVQVPEWPESKLLYRSALLSLPCFDTPVISAEDRERTRMYATERRRTELKRNVKSLDEWLETLEIRVDVEELTDVNLKRTVQLLNRTNQMNLTTRRTTEAELVDWLDAGHRKLWTFRVADRFGDSGLTGIASMEVDHTIGHIVDFVLSCRVVGRRIEEAMLDTVIAYARDARLEKVCATYIPTPKNAPCLAFWKRSGFVCEPDGCRFSWQVRRPYKPPDGILIARELRT